MNVNDYLLWRGDIPFSETFPINEIDSLILSRFSYLPFDKIDLLNNETIESISLKMNKLKEEDFKLSDDKILISNLGKSDRFKQLIVTDFYQNKSLKSEKQFGAITIHLYDGIYVSYIGTDNSIIGWKEDFNMSFLKCVPAQIEGVKYLNLVASKYKGSIRLGGHSKGGNVAVYSSLNCDKKIQNRIIRVTNYDGPGFDKSVIKKSKHLDVLNRVITYIPQDSVIGRVLEHEEDYEIVYSKEKGLYQHDIYSWEVLKNDLVKVDKVTDSSEFINDTLRTWLKNTSPKQRKIFVDSIFELLYSTSTDTFRQLSTNLIKELPSMMVTYKEISKEDKKLINDMIIEFVKASSVIMKQMSSLKIEELKKSILNKN